MNHLPKIKSFAESNTIPIYITKQNDVTSLYMSKNYISYELYTIPKYTGLFKHVSIDIFFKVYNKYFYSKKIIQKCNNCLSVAMDNNGIILYAVWIRIDLNRVFINKIFL